MSLKAIWNAIFNSKKRDFLVHKLENALMQKDSKECIKIGIAYRDGDEVEQSLQKAHECFLKAAEMGDSEGYICLALLQCHCNNLENFDIQVINKKALEYLEKAGNMGDSLGYILLGSIYENANGVEQDCLKALDFYQKAVALKEGDGLFRIGQMYEKAYIEPTQELLDEFEIDSSDSDKNISIATQYYLIAANSMQSADACLKIAKILYDDYKALEKDNEEKALEFHGDAIEYYQKAGEYGNPKGYTELGLIYAWGDSIIEYDFEKGIKYFQKAASMGDSQAYLELGILASVGEECSIYGFDRAITYFQKAIDMGNFEGYTKMAATYGEWAYKVDDRKQASAYFDKSATYWQKVGEMGEFIGYFNAGRLYESAGAMAGKDKIKGVKINEQKAFECFLKAANMGDTKSCLKVGVAYYDGNGVEKDYTKAFEYFHEVIKKENNEKEKAKIKKVFYTTADILADAHIFLGRMYASGFGVEEDHNKAYEHFLEGAQAEVGKHQKAFAYSGIALMYHLREDDEFKALPYYQKAASLGNAYSINYLKNR
ncbi:tetratricopeptide repeat protein [Helicobacter cetorum]|uniref:beta-lactamase n=1 Tax=Helicobacter cetorum (strain ATCC BAA-429 / MIT 00-7128) TaxID=182217 RepID=I0ELV9_HELC0|nr:tetratricopeptide repeat protein [Helicobacter cetorum]AFI03928.1 hypothetical protein HCW_03235 [Helicobacter cetorum MIT 00-7128]